MGRQRSEEVREGRERSEERLTHVYSVYRSRGRFSDSRQERGQGVSSLCECEARLTETEESKTSESTTSTVYTAAPGLRRPGQNSVRSRVTSACAVREESVCVKSV